MLEKILKSHLHSKEIKPVNPKRNQPWIFIWRTDTEAEISILWPLDAKSWLTGKYWDAGKDWRQEKKGTTEGQLVGWHHQLNRHEFEQTLGDGEGQGDLVCNSPQDHTQSDITDQLNSNLHACFPTWQQALGRQATHLARCYITEWENKYIEVRIMQWTITT